MPGAFFSAKRRMLRRWIKSFCGICVAMFKTDQGWIMEAEGQDFAVCPGCQSRVSSRLRWEFCGAGTAGLSPGVLSARGFRLTIRQVILMIE
jgi:hypothetical protein